MERERERDRKRGREEMRKTGMMRKYQSRELKETKLHLMVSRAVFLKQA